MEKLKSFFTYKSLLTFFVLTLFLKGVMFIYQVSPQKLTAVYFLVTFFAITFVLSPALYFKKKSATIYLFFISFIISTLYLIDLVYFRYFSAIPSISSLFYAKQVTGVGESVTGLLRIHDTLLFIDFLPAIYLLKKQKENNSLNYRQKSFLMALSLLSLFVIFLVDSGTYFKKFVNNAYEAKLVTQRYGVLGNHFIDAFRFIFIREEKLTDQEQKEALGWIRENVVNKAEANEYTGLAKDKRIIMLQVESLQNFVIGKRVESQEITPNLNRLLGESKYFENNYFLIGLGNTSDSDLVANTSLYPLGDAAAFVRYPKSNYTSLPLALKEAGYTPNAYHAFHRDFWNRERLFKNFGYENYYAKENYPEGKRVGMGLSDSVFLPETVKIIKTQPEKSFNYLITLSSHFPFSLNDEDKVLKLTQDLYTPEIYRYYNSIAYADAQIGVFIEELKKEGLYDDTLLVVYGDHRANLGDVPTAFSQKSLALAENGLAQQLTLSRTPLIIRIPGTKSEKITRVSSTVDIMPTVLNLADVKTDSPMFGTDLFSKKEPFFASVSFYQTGMIAGEKNYYFEDGTCTDINLTKVPGGECEALIQKRGAMLTNSSKLIRHNLFPLL